MGRKISLFADYHQKENSVTNYCGLILKLLYEDNPRGLDEAIGELSDYAIPLPIGPIFSQQQRGEKSVPDLVIQQTAFTIFFETKRTDWFGARQLQNHIDELKKSSGSGILFALSSEFIEDFENKFKNEIAEGHKHSLHVKAITFEMLLRVLKKVHSSPQFKSMVEEFEEFIDRNL